MKKSNPINVALRIIKDNLITAIASTLTSAITLSLGWWFHAVQDHLSYLPHHTLARLLVVLLILFGLLLGVFLIVCAYSNNLRKKPQFIYQLGVKWHPKTKQPYCVKHDLHLSEVMINTLLEGHSKFSTMPALNCPDCPEFYRLQSIQQVNDGHNWEVQILSLSKAQKMLTPSP